MNDPKLRFHKEAEPENPEQDTRLATQIDRDRLLYSRSFARLAEVTQVISADNGYVFHNRMTHSLKVAQLARRIAEKLWRDQERGLLKDDLKIYGGLDVDAAEAAGLAHDLGHPPFGHIAEEEINDRMNDYGFEEGFEGNAQSFRLVTRLSVSDAAPDETVPDIGLNLTQTTLNGILKYPWLHKNRPKPKKWGAYADDSNYMKFARDGFNEAYGEHVQSLEAAIMDIADDITYATHDVIDFYCAGKIPLDRLREDSRERKNFYDDVFRRNKDDSKFKNQRTMEQRFERIIEVFDAWTRYTGSTQQEINLWQGLTSLIGEYVLNIELKPIKKGEKLIGFKEDSFSDEIEMLKQLTWHYVILNTDLATIQFGQRRMISTLFDILFDASERWSTKPQDLKLFPRRFEERILTAAGDESKRARATADCIASMTEREVEVLYAKLKDRRNPVLPKKVAIKEEAQGLTKGDGAKKVE